MVGRERISPSVSILYHSLIRFARRVFQSCRRPKLFGGPGLCDAPAVVDDVAAGYEAAIDKCWVVEPTGFGRVNGIDRSKRAAWSEPECPVIPGCAVDVD